jgi:hypothetical protein
MPNHRSRRHVEPLPSSTVAPVARVLKMTPLAPDRSRRPRQRRPVARREIRTRSGPVQPSRSLHAAHPRVAFYIGLALVAAFELIEWPVAIIIGLGHEITQHAHRRAVREFVEGIESGV